MKAAFNAVRSELRIWRDEGRVLPLWLRDDDAVEPTPALDRLTALAARYGAPLHLAVIPARAHSELAALVQDRPGIWVLAHGWAHANHALASEKKAEFGAHRPLAAMREEIEHGKTRLEALFTDRALPVFTPPWNRVAADVLDMLPGIGFGAISTFAPRQARYAAPGLMQVNTHIDPIDWRGGRSAVDAELLAVRLAGDLAARRAGAQDNSEPYGLLTHHLVHDAAIWSVTASLLDVLTESGACRWTLPFEASDVAR